MDNNRYENEQDYNEEQENVRTAAPEKTLRWLFVGIIALLIVIGIIFGIINHSSKKKKEPETTTAPELTTEATTVPEELYKPGDYIINSPGSLRLREGHSVSAAVILAIPNSEKVTVTEIFKDDAEASEEHKYWGKTVYLGREGWIAMYYTVNKSASSVIIPEELTTVPENTTAATETKPTEQQSSLAPQTTKAPVQTTAPVTEPSVASAETEYSAGKYIVNAKPYVHIRENHGVDYLSIGQLEYERSITITEIYKADTESSALKYWGKTTIEGKTGWVCMSNLKKAN